MAAVVLLLGCSTVEMPPPREAAELYSDAIQRGDIELLHGMMTQRARAAIQPEDIAELLASDGEELSIRAEDFLRDSSQSEGEALVFLQGGETATLSIESGEFFVSDIGVLPRRSRTPEKALLLLRGAVQARQVGPFLSLLTKEGRGKFEEVFLSLERSLEGLDTASVDVRENRARVELPDGLVIELRREGKTWRIEDIR